MVSVLMRGIFPLWKQLAYWPAQMRSRRPESIDGITWPKILPEQIRDYFNSGDNHAEQSAKCRVTGHQLSLVGSRSRINDCIRHRQFVFVADVSGSERQAFVQRHDDAPKRFRDETVSLGLAAFPHQYLDDFVENYRGEQRRACAFDVRSESFGVFILSQIFQPGRGVNQPELRNGRYGHDNRLSISSPWRFREVQS